MISFYPGYFGWLGNQMFQYAATFSESKRLGTSCGFPENNPNLFELFTLSAEKLSYSQGIVYQEPTFHYKEIPKQDNITLHGYFQSEKYFIDCKEDIKSEFSLRTPSYPETLDDEYISLHVRRGDYLKYPGSHPLCGMEYYEEALCYLPDRPVKVFSDDWEWCTKNFQGDRFHISSRNFMEDFELMTKCQHHIIANSSFSWWGAWLSNSEKVIAPKKWFGPEKHDHNTKDLYPEGWIVI
jgi:hypothetical protein